MAFKGPREIKTFALRSTTGVCKPPIKIFFKQKHAKIIVLEFHASEGLMADFFFLGGGRGLPVG